MRSVQPRARQLLQIEFSGKDASPDEVPGPGMALAVGEDRMGMQKWLAIQKRDVAGAGGKLHRHIYRDDVVLVAGLIIVAEVRPGEGTDGIKAGGFYFSLSDDIGYLAYDLSAIVKPCQKAPALTAISNKQFMSPPDMI